MACGGIWLPLVAIGMILASAAINEAGAFRFLKQPSRFRNVFNKQNVVLDCRTTDPLSKSTLYHQGKAVSTSSGSSISKNGSIYVIQSLQIKQIGMYRCEALSSSGQKIFWQTILLYILSSLSLTVNPINSMELQGDSFNLTCVVKYSGASADLIKIKWQKQVGSTSTFTDISSSRVLRTNHGINNKLNLILLFKNAVRMPKTKYRCSAGIGRDDAERVDAFVTVLVREAPKITAFPTKEIVLTKHQDFIIKCTARAVPYPKVRWFKNGKELSLCNFNCKSKGYSMITCNYQNDVHVNSHNCLKILSAKHQRDEGKYTCVAENGFGPSDSQSISAVFNLAPQIDKSHLSTIFAPYNTAQMLSCGVVNGYPRPLFSWFYQIMICGSNDKCVPDDKKWRSVPSNHLQQPPSNMPSVVSNLTIPASGDPAFYKCRSSNVIGEDSKIFQFQRSRIDAPGVVIKTTKRINAEETLTARCIISKGRFSEWLKNGVKIPASGGDPRISIVTSLKMNPGKETTTLTIVNTTNADSGQYRCMAKTLVGNIVLNSSRTIRVKAVYQPNITSLPNVTAYDYFNNITHAQIVCHVDANPMATITWYKSGFELTGLTEQDSCLNKVRDYYVLRTASGSRNTLLICNVMDEQHTDLYTCSAKNKKGKDKKSAYLDVLTPPRIQSDQSYKKLTIPIGEPVNVTCAATGNPQPVVEWRKIASNGSTILWRSLSGPTIARLEIHALDHESLGNYTCVAANLVGTAFMQLDVRELLVPTHQRRTDPLITIVASSVGGVLGLVFLVGLLLCCHANRRNRRLIEEYKALRYLRKGEDYKIDPDRSLLEQCEDLPYDADWEFPEERLEFHGVIGSGTFGQVMKADAIGILSFVPRDKTSDAFRRRSRLRRRLSSSRMYQDSDGNQYNKTTVAVKTLKAEATESDYKDLATELKIMIHLGEHNNIINLLGACTRGKQLMVVMEYAPHGNLLNFLRSHREIYEATWRKTANNPDVEITLADLVMYSYQIARGMDFLSSKKCVHRDLAARNILVGEDYVMKIADFGLARDIKNTDVYVKQTTGLLPVKWMAPESLFDRHYTEKTDVWSFGVILWETQTLGGTPYPGIPVEELLDYISEGKRMRQPKDCPTEIYAIMRDCWLQKPSERPTFSELVRRIERILEKKITGEETENSYISVFMDEDLHRIYYLEPTDTFSEASGTSGSARLMSTQSSMTEEELTRSPLPPIPCQSLEDIHELNEETPNKYVDFTEDHVNDYCEPCDNVRKTPLNSDSTQQLSNGTIKTNYDTNYNFHRSDRRRESQGSTGVESGIGLEESFLGSEKDHSIDRKKTNDKHLCSREKRSKNPFVAERVALLNAMLFKDKTKETML